MYWLFVPAFVILLGLAVHALHHAAEQRRKNAYVGYGWRLAWKDGKVLIQTVFPKSPAARAGVQAGTQLFRFNGHILNFNSSEDFRFFMLARAVPSVGELGHFVFLFEGKLSELTLATERITRVLPAPQPVRDLAATMRDPDIRQAGMAVRHRGGKTVIVLQTQLSDEAISRL